MKGLNPMQKSVLAGVLIAAGVGPIHAEWFEMSDAFKDLTLQTPRTQTLSVPGGVAQVSGILILLRHYGEKRGYSASAQELGEIVRLTASNGVVNGEAALQEFRSRVQERPLVRDLARLAAENGRFTDDELAYMIKSLDSDIRVDRWGFREFIFSFDPGRGASLFDYGPRPDLDRREYLLVSAQQLGEGPFVISPSDHHAALVYAPEGGAPVRRQDVLAALERIQDQRKAHAP